MRCSSTSATGKRRSKGKERHRGRVSFQKAGLEGKFGASPVGIAFQHEGQRLARLDATSINIDRKTSIIDVPLPKSHVICGL